MTARALASCAFAAAMTGSLSAAHAQGTPLDDDALSGVWGQALLDLTNTSLGGYDFSRITLNADVSLSANLTGLKLGNYDYAPRNGTGSDIDISRMSFGRSDLDDAHRTVQITNPYFEWVYSGDANAANRQVVGMRMGFGGISGDVGLQMNTVSGSLVIDTGSGTQVNSANDTSGLAGKRWDGLAGCATCTTPLSAIGGVTAGNATDGPSRDFFISLLKTALTYPAVNGITPAQSQAGFWLNWTDRLAALNTTGVVPPNTPKTGP
jgi:hypothetical protein